MSHIVHIQTEVRDPVAVSAACRRLGLAAPVHGTAELFVEKVTGLIVQLPDWLYPVVCDTASGKVQFDNYEGRWGDPQHLNRFLQAYAVERAGLEARKQGHTVHEQPLADGSIKLTIQVAGGCRMIQTIEIIISPTGQSRIETKGFAGSTCRAASQFLEQALGTRTGEQLTAEFHHSQQTEQTQHTSN